MKYAKYIILTCLILFALSCVGYFIKGCSETQEVLYEEFSPRTMLQKYEWLKDASAKLDALNADIKIYTSKLTAMDSSYQGVPRNQWDRFDKQQYNLWISEIAGTKAAFNDLASTYNSQMAKFNWAFANMGTLPKGASDPLPREYKPYINN